MPSICIFYAFIGQLPSLSNMTPRAHLRAMRILILVKGAGNPLITNAWRFMYKIHGKDGPPITPLVQHAIAVFAIFTWHVTGNRIMQAAIRGTFRSDEHQCQNGTRRRNGSHAQVHLWSRQRAEDGHHLDDVQASKTG